MRLTKNPHFRNRQDAGKRLAGKLTAYANRDDVLILALPRGGVPVAFEVAHVLHAPLDVFVVRKLGVPQSEETAMGAIASGGIRVLNRQIVEAWDISDTAVEAVIAKERRELQRREQAYRDDRPQPIIEGKTVILVDDGLATGATMHAAVLALKKYEPAWLVVAVPVASVQTCEAFQDHVDEVVCVVTPEPFYAVGLWYAEFEQTTDDEVRHLLRRAQAMIEK